LVVIVVVVVVVSSTGSEAVVERVETGRDGDHYRCDGERVEERRQDRCDPREGEGQQKLGFHTDEQFGEHQQQDVPHEIDASDHEHQQQDDGEVRLSFVVHRFRTRHPERDRFDCEETAGLQRVAPQGHCEAEDELCDDEPTGYEWASEHQDKRVREKEPHDAQFVPTRGVPEEVAAERGGECAHHGCVLSSGGSVDRRRPDFPALHSRSYRGVRGEPVLTAERKPAAGALKRRKRVPPIERAQPRSLDRKWS
jgi:hypothetical protein